MKPEFKTFFQISNQVREACREGREAVLLPSESLEASLAAVERVLESYLKNHKAAAEAAAKANRARRIPESESKDPKKMIRERERRAKLAAEKKAANLDT